MADNWERFRKCAVDVLSVDADKVTPEAKFGDDLDADSLDLVELVMALEEEFGVEVPEEDLEREVRSAYGIFTGEPTDEAVLRFSAHRAQWVSKEVWHGKQASRWLEDGRYELKVPYRWTEELLMDILKYGPDCEVVAPPQLRTAVADASRRLASMYGDASA